MSCSSSLLFHELSGVCLSTGARRPDIKGCGSEPDRWATSLHIHDVCLSKIPREAAELHEQTLLQVSLKTELFRVKIFQKLHLNVCVCTGNQSFLVGPVRMLLGLISSPLALLCARHRLIACICDWMLTRLFFVIFV